MESSIFGRSSNRAPLRQLGQKDGILRDRKVAPLKLPRALNGMEKMLFHIWIFASLQVSYNVKDSRWIVNTTNEIQEQMDKFL